MGKLANVFIAALCVIFLFVAVTTAAFTYRFLSVSIQMDEAELARTKCAKESK